VSDSQAHEFTVLVAGANGVVGSGIVERLAAEGRRVLCITGSGRRAAEGSGMLQLDLLDSDACMRELARHPRIEHVFFAAYRRASDPAAEIAVNTAMLRNLAAAADAQLPGLRKFVLVTGAKTYGDQSSPNRTPARESQPRQLAPSFYYGQQDALRALKTGKRWSWVELIPPFVSGVATGSPMNLVLGLGIHATVSRELGVPLRYPGTSAAYDALHQFADARLIGAAASWAMRSDAAHDEAFNIANGDPARWSNTWPAMAAHLGMTCAEPKRIRLARAMPLHQPTWERIAQRHGLQALDIADAVDWEWMDFMLSIEHDVVLEIGKARRAGFDACLETEACLFANLEALRARRILPGPVALPVANR
jgi:nucleoside-diphosphate-sugar epimerase